MSVQASALYFGWVKHRRLRPRRHFLRYRTFALLIDLDEAAELGRRMRLFSVNRFNLFSFRESDYGAPGGGSLRGQIDAWLAQAGLAGERGPIRLLTLPRILGYAFNPISIFFCYLPEGGLKAVIYEVRNTFGQKHCYLIPVAAGDGDVIEQSCAKELYVSPFMPMAMTYDFTLRPPGRTLSIAIAERDEGGVVMTATQSQTRAPLSDLALVKAFFGYPLLTLKVIAGIHFEALRLWAKGMKLQPRPAAPANLVTFVPLGAGKRDL